MRVTNKKDAHKRHESSPGLQGGPHWKSRQDRAAGLAFWDLVGAGRREWAPGHFFKSKLLASPTESEMLRVGPSKLYSVYPSM